MSEPMQAMEVRGSADGLLYGYVVNGSFEPLPAPSAGMSADHVVAFAEAHLSTDYRADAEKVIAAVAKNYRDAGRVRDLEVLTDFCLRMGVENLAGALRDAGLAPDSPHVVG